MSSRSPGVHIAPTVERLRYRRIAIVGRSSATANALALLAFGPISRDDNSALAALVADRVSSFGEVAR